MGIKAVEFGDFADFAGQFRSVAGLLIDFLINGS